MLLALDEDARFSLLLHLRKLGTECCRNDLFGLCCYCASRRLFMKKAALDEVKTKEGT